MHYVREVNKKSAKNNAFNEDLLMFWSKNELEYLLGFPDQHNNSHF